MHSVRGETTRVHGFSDTSSVRDGLFLRLANNFKSLHIRTDS